MSSSRASGSAPWQWPVLIAFPEPLARSDSWGRLLALSAAGATLLTLARLAVGERLHLSFDVCGEPIGGLRTVVDSVEIDLDGYCAAEVRFLDSVDKRRLAKVLLDVLSRG